MRSERRRIRSSSTASRSTRGPTPSLRRRRRSRRAASDPGSRSQLPAGGLDVAAAREAYRHGDARALELVPEGGDPLARRALVEAGRVVRDQFDLEVVAAE